MWVSRVCVPRKQAPPAVRGAALEEATARAQEEGAAGAAAAAAAPALLGPALALLSAALACPASTAAASKAFRAVCVGSTAQAPSAIHTHHLSLTQEGAASNGETTRDN